MNDRNSRNKKSPITHHNKEITNLAKQKFIIIFAPCNVAKMNAEQKYSIDYQGLKLGRHEFHFDVSDDIFTMWEESEIKKGILSVDVILNRQSAMMELEISIKGEVELVCDRCLDEFWQPIDYFGKLIVKISDEQGEYDGDIMWIHPSDSRLSLAQYIYESVILSLPYQRVHASIEQCNADMLSRFSIVNEQDDIE